MYSIIQSVCRFLTAHAPSKGMPMRRIDTELPAMIDEPAYNLVAGSMPLSLNTSVFVCRIGMHPLGTLPPHVLRKFVPSGFTMMAIGWYLRTRWGCERSSGGSRGWRRMEWPVHILLLMKPTCGYMFLPNLYRMPETHGSKGNVRMRALTCMGSWD